MSLINDLVKLALDGQSPHLSVGDWQGSVNGHPNSLTVVNGAIALHGTTLAGTFDFTLPNGAASEIEHILGFAMPLPHGAPSIVLDQKAAAGGKIAILGHTVHLQPRLELIFYLPTSDDPLRHFRFDAEIHRS